MPKAGETGTSRFPPSKSIAGEAGLDTWNVHPTKTVKNISIKNGAERSTKKAMFFFQGSLPLENRGCRSRIVRTLISNIAFMTVWQTKI